MALEQAGVALIAQGANAYIGDMKAATNATDTFVDSTDKGSGRVSSASQVMIGALRHVGTMAVDAFAQAAKATAAFVGDSISLAGDFDQKMSVLQATSGATAEEMEQLSAKAKELGSDLSLPATSAVDAGEAMLELAKSGFTVTEQMDAAKGVLQLAAAAQIDEAKAAEINANALQAFGLEANKSMFVSDLLAASANASSISATDMADTYKMAGAIFSAFQGPVVGSEQALIDLTTAASLLGNAGIKGSDAGTALKQSLLQLTAPSDKAKGKMKELAEIVGITGDIAYDAQGKMRSFPEILGLVTQSTKDLTEEKRNEYVSTIFGADAARAILILMQQGPDAWDKMTSAVTRQGSAQELAAAQTQGFNGALEGAKSQIETLQLSIGQALTPILAELLNTYISPGIASITAFADSFLKMVPAIAASDDPLRTFLNALKIAAPGLYDVIIAVEKFKDAITPAVQEIMKLVDAFNQGGLGGLIDTLITDLEAAIPDIKATLADWGNAFVDWITPMIPPMLKMLDDLVNEAWGWVKAQAPVWANQLLAWGGELVAWIAPMIPPAIAELGKLASQFIGWIGDQAKPLLAKFNDWATSFVAWIVPATVTFLAEWPKMFDQFLDWVGDAAGPLLKQLGDWALSFIQWIAPMIPPFLVALGGVALAVGVWVIETAAVLSKKIVEKWIPAILGWIVTDAIPGLVIALDNFLKVFDGWIKDAQRDLGLWMRGIGTSIVEGIKKGISDAWSSLSNWLSDKISGLFDVGMDAQLAKSPSKLWEPAGASIVQGIMLGLSSTWPQLTDLVGSLASGLTESMRDIGQQMQEVIADSFGATASIDRQIARNIGALKDVLPEHMQATTRALQEAQNQASDFADPAEGAQFFQMRSRQILEYAKLQSDLATEQQNADDAFTAQAEEAMKLDELRAQLAVATTEKEIEAIMKQMDAANKAADANRLLRIEAQSAMERIAAQITLITRAQSAERSQFEAQKTNTSPTLDIADQINAIMKSISGLNLTDDQIKIVDMLAGVWAGLQTPITSQQGLAPPQTQYHPTSGGSTSTTTTNVSMPIYTNQTPQVLQQSWAIMQASMA